MNCYGLLGVNPTGICKYLTKQGIVWRRFRDAARASRLDLTYLEGEGDHTWPVWARQIGHYVPWAIGAQY